MKLVGSRWHGDRGVRREQSRRQVQRDAVERTIRKKRISSGKAVVSLNKKRVTPHVLRHRAPMQLLKTHCRHP